MATNAALDMQDLVSARPHNWPAANGGSIYPRAKELSQDLPGFGAEGMHIHVWTRVMGEKAALPTDVRRRAFGSISGANRRWILKVRHGLAHLRRHTRIGTGTTFRQSPG